MRQDPLFVPKSIIMMSCIIFDLYFGSLLYGGKQLALQLGGALGLLMVASDLIGFFMQH
jgi:hypothetical protein